MTYIINATQKEENTVINKYQKCIFNSTFPSHAFRVTESALNC